MDLLLGGADSSAGEEEGPANAWEDALARVGEPEPYVAGSGWATALANIPEGSGSGSEEHGDGSNSAPDAPPDAGEDEVEVAPEGAEDGPLAIIAALPSRVDALGISSRRIPDENLDQIELKCCMHYVRDKVHIGSLAAEANRLGVDRNKLRANRTLSAAASVDFERRSWASVEEGVRKQAEAGRCSLKVDLEAYTYDGVDLTVGTRTRPGAVCNFDVPALADEPAAHELAVAEVKDHIEQMPDEVDIAKAKLLNSTHTILMMVGVGSTNVILQGESCTWVQSLDRNTAENIRAATEALNMGAAETRAEFARRLRLVATDAASYNLRAERDSRDDGTVLIHLLCNAHVLAGIHTKVYCFCSDTISGMQKTSGSLMGGGTMRNFRKALRRVLARDLKLIHQAPSEDAMAYKRTTLDLFLGDTVDRGHLRAVVSRCASGDWRKPNTFEYLVTDGEGRVEVLKKLYTHFVPAVCAHAPKKFPQSRWTGADLAVADLGILACIHGLLGRAYQEFMDRYFPSGAKSGGVGMPGLDGTGIPWALAIAGESAPPPAQISEHSAEAQRRNRGVALTWTTSPSVCMDLAIVAIALRPMHRYMCREIDMSSALWGTAQADARIGKLRETSDIREFFVDSQWPVLAAAIGETTACACVKSQTCTTQHGTTRGPTVGSRCTVAINCSRCYRGRALA